MSKGICIFIVICLLASMSLAQRSNKVLFSCSYGEENRGSELCAKIQMESFASNAHAERAIDKILKPLGLRRNFVLVSCPNINNAKAVTYEDGIRYIIYDNAFMERIDRGANTDWASLSVLAHEVGHHLQGHSLRRVGLQQMRMNELEADEFSGFVMFKLGASLGQAQAAMNNLRDVYDEENSTHPKRWRRLEAIKTGYSDAKSQQPLEDIDTKQSAEAFFSKAFALQEQKKYREALENYTVAIGLNPQYSFAYINRGAAKVSLQDYRGAIEDFTKAIQLDPNSADAYSNRGSAKLFLQDYRGTIEDSNQAVRLNSKNAGTYYNRGGAKYFLQDYQGAIEDFSKAIRLKPNYADAYNIRAGAKIKLADKSGACVDFRNACSLGLTQACNNANQVCSYR